MQSLNPIRLEAAAQNLWSCVTDPKVKMELRSTFEQLALGFLDTAAEHLAQASELATRRVNLTPAACGHISHAVDSLEDYDNVQVRSSFVLATAWDLLGIVGHLKELDPQERIVQDSDCDMSDEFLASLVRRSQNTINKAVQAINKTLSTEMT